ncbi:MAG: MBL fold metallo-hydrolase, partial [Acidimicrobiales bacterium]
MSGGAYFRQLLAGVDFARGDALARQMRNFAYVIGDADAGEAVVVDAAYAPEELVELTASDGLRVVGALVTHYHWDHAGGPAVGVG